MVSGQQIWGTFEFKVNNNSVAGNNTIIKEKLWYAKIAVMSMMAHMVLEDFAQNIVNAVLMQKSKRIIQLKNNYRNVKVFIEKQN